MRKCSDPSTCESGTAVAVILCGCVSYRAVWTTLCWQDAHAPVPLRSLEP
jgi:hypothetical protein